MLSSSLRHFADAVDRGLTHRWTRPLPRPLDELLETLSRAADHSVLWLVTAAAGASLGGERGRRAAGRGVLALAATSATVNGPIKLLFGRRRPPGRSRLRRRLRTSSFPSGHSASGFAFAVAASRELPEAGPVLVPLAAGVAFSRVYLGVHHPTDVIAGAAFGTVVGLAGRPAVRRMRMDVTARRQGSAPPSRSRAELVVSPHAGNSRKLARARRVLESCGIHVEEELDIEYVDRLPGLLQTADGAPRLVIAAGGDGTHAATAGLNVDFARLATQASLRARLGRLTYLVAALYAVRERNVFTCALEHDGVVDELDLLQLSVISAPVIGGALGLSVRGPFPDDHRLDVLAVEDVQP